MRTSLSLPERLGIAVIALALLSITAFAINGLGSSAEVAAHARYDRAGAPTESARIAAQDDGEDVSADEVNDDGSVTLTLLHNNDGESKLLPNTEAGFPGIARFANEWIGQGRDSDADILLRVSSGDNFLASKELSVGLDRPADEPVFDSLALRGLYEVMGLGNHDFDFGPETTARFIEGFRIDMMSDQMPFVAANLDVSAEPALQRLVNEGILVPSTIYTDPASGIDIGVIGAVTPRLGNISSPRDVQVNADIAGVVNAEVQALADQGVDRVVLLSHLQGLGEDQDLVTLLSGVDIVVAGGSDELLRNDGDSCQVDLVAAGPYPLLSMDADGNDVPIVTAPGGYRCIGRLDVTFNAAGRISTIDGGSIGVPLTGDQEMFALTRVEEPLTAALVELEESIVGQSAVVLDGRRSSVRTAATNAGELLADALLASGSSASDFGGEAAVVAVQNAGGIRNDAEITAGDISEADTFDIAPFANFVVTGAVPRDQFRDMLEVAVSGLPEAEGTFPQIAGFTMVFDAAEPAREIDREGDCSLIGDAGSRVRTVTLDDGTEIIADGDVVPGDDIVLATIDFLAGGGDCYPLDDLEFTPIGMSYQQALASFIADDLGGEITADDYPVGGSRSSLVNPDEVDSLSLTPDDVEDPDADAADADEAEDAAAAADEVEDDDTAVPAEAGAAQDEPAAQEELARTGVETELLLVVALTIAAAGAMIFFEARRVGWLSLSSRLRVTHISVDGKPVARRSLFTRSNMPPAALRTLFSRRSQPPTAERTLFTDETTD